MILAKEARGVCESGFPPLRAAKVFVWMGLGLSFSWAYSFVTVLRERLFYTGACGT